MEVTFERVQIEPAFKPVRLTLTFKSSDEITVFYHLLDCWRKKEICDRPNDVRTMAERIMQSDEFDKLLESRP